jgi:hypothetical protein
MLRWALNSGGRSCDASAMLRRLPWVVAVCGLLGGCLEDYKLPHNSGSLGGQVVLSGGVRGARVSVDQLDAHTGDVYQHVGAAITDEDGRFLIPETREANALFRLISRGGSFTDLASGATILLDDNDTIHSLLWFPIVDRRTDALISPVGHLIEARAWSRLATFGDMTAAVNDATEHVAMHFGRANWGLLKLHDLNAPATSPTEPVRAALVHAALSFLVADIAAASGASAQQINVYTLMQRWTTDLVAVNEADPAVWDGNDGDDRTPGSGLQLGACEPIAPTCAVPSTGCNLGHCRSACDLYSGTPRAALAGALTKVIRDGSVNRTGLRIEDTLALARAIAENMDPSLFGAACVENLDRTPPGVRWDDAASAPADAVVRGTFTLKAIGLDDIDLQPRTEIVGYADQDGDPSNNVAIAHIDTAGMSDGGLTVIARAVDLAGNSATAERRVVIDNTAPQISLSSAGFLVDSDNATWWTPISGPSLTGTVFDANPATVQATIGSMQVPGTLSGGSWSVDLPDGTLDLAGANVTIRVTDRAGNHAEITRRIRHDASPPMLSFQTSTLNNEAPESPTFSSGNILEALNHIPVHMHGGPTVNLDVTGSCPAVAKYSYLLGEHAPAYGYEVDSQGNARRNPIRYQLVAADDGVGIAPGSTQYRVGRRSGATTTWILDWTSTGPGTPIAPGVTQHGVGIYSNLVAGLATTEGIYDVQFRTADRLARTTTVARCFDLKLKAPPLEMLPESAPITPHTYQLDALSLAPGAPFDLVAARLLNGDATGASLIDQPFYNGTANTVYFTATLTKPTRVDAAQSYVVDHARLYSYPVELNCSAFPGTGGNPADCIDPGPRYLSGVVTSTSVAATFRVRVFELNASGAPVTEIPCIGACDPATTTTFKFAIPPRAAPPGGAPARKYIAMTMIGPVPALWPNGGVAPAPPGVSAPFVDEAIAGGMPRITGLVKPFVNLCTRVEMVGPINNRHPYCKERSEVIPYRALTMLRLYVPTIGSDPTLSAYATAPTEGSPPIPIGELRSRPVLDRTLTEGTLPSYYP